MTQLDKIISNLKEKSEIDAVFITGSQENENKPYSDIDLVIIMNTGTDIKSLFQWVDNKPCEVHFFNIEELTQKLEKDNISPNDPEGLIVSFLEKADVRFDKTGILTSYKNNFGNIARKLQVPESKKIWFDGLINWAYITNKRYFESNNSNYWEALEIKLSGDLNLLIKAYFEFRDIPWRGEKQVVEYLKTIDTEFYNVYMSCLRESSLKEKYGIYTKLINLVFYGNYKLWNKEIVYPSAQNQSSKGQEHLIKYWKKLIS